MPRNLLAFGPSIPRDSSIRDSIITVSSIWFILNLLRPYSTKYQVIDLRGLPHAKNLLNLLGCPCVKYLIFINLFEFLHTKYPIFNLLELSCAKYPVLINLLTFVDQVFNPRQPTWTSTIALAIMSSFLHILDYV